MSDCIIHKKEVYYKYFLLERLRYAGAIQAWQLLSVCIYKQKEVTAMLTAKVFQSGNSQAIRIPKKIRLPAK